jgi:hypothetical protein
VFAEKVRQASGGRGADVGGEAAKENFEALALRGHSVRRTSAQIVLLS